MRRAAAATALVLALALAPATVVAQRAAPDAGAPATDYDLDSGAWNGLASFAALARGLGFEVETARQLAWDDVGPGDVLVVLYPTRVLEDDHVAGFLANGGRLVLGDDFGAAAGALLELGLVRQAAVGLVADRYLDDRQGLPIARPLAGHPLAAGVDGLTCNHPALFTSVEGPSTAVFGFGDGAVVVAAGQLGAGRFVALADPSVLINRMLELEGNLAFARALLEHLAGSGSGRVVIVTGGFDLTGAPSRPLAGGDATAGALGRVNRWLVGLSDYYVEKDAMRIIALMLAIAAGAVALRTLPGRRPGGLDGAWTRVPAQGGAPDAAELVAALDRPGARGHGAAAALIRDEVDRRLGRALAVDGPLAALTEDELGRAAGRWGRGAQDALAELLPLVRGLGPRGAAEPPWTAAPLGRREFDRLAAAATRLYRSLDGEAGAPRREPPA